MYPLTFKLNVYNILRYMLELLDFLFQGNIQHLLEDVFLILDTSFTRIETARIIVTTTRTVQPILYLSMDPIGVRRSKESGHRGMEEKTLLVTLKEQR